MADCEKCGDMVLSGQPRLSGGRTAALCIKCINLWHEHIWELGLWERYTLSMREGERLLMSRTSTALEVESVAKSNLKIEDEMYKESKKWLDKKET